MSAKSPFSLSRQGTLRSSTRRKASLGTPLNLNPGRRSPVMLSPRSPGEYPGFAMATERKSPTAIYAERRSPTSNIQIQGRRSPIGFYEPDRRSPTSTVHVQDRRSPVGFLDDIEEGRRSPTVQVQGRRSPIGFSHGLITCIPITTPTDKKPQAPGICLSIPPITVSNPSETCAIIEKTLQSSIRDAMTPDRPVSPVQERKEQRSVIRDIMAFVRKPSKKVSSAAPAVSPPTTAASNSRTGRFAAAFSRAESGSGSPLLRQSTFSSSPAASSRAAKSAVTKQMSEAAMEPKMSFRLLNSKMSLRLRRATPDDKNKSKDKRSSGDEMSDLESSDSRCDRADSTSSGGAHHFELENVRFDKVGESYIKHDKIREETLEDKTPSPVAQTTEQADSCKRLKDDDDDDEDGLDSGMSLLKSQLSHLVAVSQGSFGSLLQETNPENHMQIQCPTFEIMPPSRRSSFDPPRSPYLDQLRSPCDTDPELMVLNRLDSGGDSFELVDTDKNRESSFESRYPSSSHTSFDISRYQSTSYDDQTSSFEIIDLDTQRSSIDDKRSPIDLRKSSIEIIDIDAFKRSETAGRKSSLETHFDYQSPSTGLAGLLRAKRQVSEPSRCRECSPSLTMKTHHSAPNRARSPLSNQTSSNYSSRDSYDSNFEPVPLRMAHGLHPEMKSPYSDKTRKHFPLAVKPNAHTEAPAFLCTDQRCSSIFEPRPGRSGSLLLAQPPTGEFDPPSPRRAASASPKHTFTFRIVMKKVDSSPDDICPSAERRRSRERNERIRRRDSRKKRLQENGKSF